MVVSFVCRFRFGYVFCVIDRVVFVSGMLLLFVIRVEK